MATRTCPQCGAVNPASSKFCDACGINLTQRLHTTRPVTPPGAAPRQSGGAPSAGGAPRGATRPAPPTPGAATRAVTPTSGAASGPQPGLPLTAGMALGDGGRYVIDKPLGKGGMGSIFLAHDVRVNDKPVVIKQMLPNYSTDEERLEAEQSFQEEMKTLAAMSHPSIPAITDYFTESGFNFIVQEYIPGEDLQKKLDAAGGKGLPEKQVLAWCSQVLSVLDYLEGLDPQIVHRDIKPANIVVEPSGRVRVVDFGVASHKFRVGTPNASKNRVSTAMGTPGYAPREQFQGQETPLSDLYALGATMHQLLTGRNPQGVEPLFVYPPVRQLNPSVSEAAAHITTRALQNDPKQRYQRARDMKAEIDAILQPKGALSTARGKAIALVAVIVLLLAAGGGAALFEKRAAELPATGAISTGKVAFDRDVTGRDQSATDPKAWAQAKADASVQWKDGNLSRAQALYQQAVTNDQTDAESQIYSENAGILLANQPYYVIGVGGSFSGADISAGRFDLQGAYTAQHEINQNGGINGHKIVLELANDASGASGATEAAKAAAQDTNMLAFVGYAFSSRTKASLPYLAQAGIPQLSPTSSNPSLNGSTYFFRAVPSDVVQGEYLARYANKALLAGKAHPTVLVFRDANDAYSNGLATIFTADMGTAATLRQLTYTVSSTTAQQYQSTLATAFQQGKPALIFFAGYASDALRMGQALDTMGDRTTPVLSDDAFYDPAQFIAYGQVYKGRYHFTGYFYPDEASLLPAGSPGAQVIASMESEYAENFHAAGKPTGYGFARVPSDAALFYDAVKLVAQAISVAARNGDVTHAGLRAAIASIHVQGMSGQIHFNQTPPAPTDANPLGVGDPIDKAMLVMHLDDLGHTHPEKMVGTFDCTTPCSAG
jgi:ABC-type branched-subunit amino acid transport system substrate-binding protein/tRNA A-37 threonylcarbamoyl transferase component Bud32